MSWSPEQLDQLAAERERKQAMRDAGVDASDPAEREAWEAGFDAGEPG